MDRLTFGRKTQNRPRGGNDRFVAPRLYCEEMRRRRSHCAEVKEPIDIWYSKHFQQKTYTDCLDEAFGLDLNDQRKDSLQPWPCQPRKKSYLSSADSVLDLPTYSYAAFPELLDWSSDNILVAALGRNYHRWSWRTQSLINQGLTLYDMHCCKFDPRGQYILLGTDMGNVEIHNNKHTKWVGGSVCICYKYDKQYCSITAVDWSPTGNSYVTGCTRGRVTSFARNSQQISCYSGTDAILLLRVSPDARYVAAATVNSDVIDIFVWPTLIKFWTLYGKCVTKTIAWHPWRSALLGVGNDALHHKPRIALLDVPSSKLEVTEVGQSHYLLDAMLFSHRTGELVMSLRNTERSLEYHQTQLVVMSDPETVVDRWGEGRNGLDRVRTMVFSPDGTKLATATVDEDLIIWNFLPEDNKKKTKNRRFSSLPVYLDTVTSGFSLR